MLKKIGTLFLAFAVLCTVMTGCENSNTNSENNNNNTETTSKITADITTENNNNNTEITPKITVDITTENAIKYSKLITHELEHRATVGNDGKVFLENFNPRNAEYYTVVSQWENIVQVSAGYDKLCALDSNGNVYATGDKYFMESINLSAFTDIVWIEATDHDIYGLKSDGTVVSTGKYALDVSSWSNVKQISASGENKDIVLGLTNDGKVLVESGYEEIYEARNWTDIIQFSAGRLHVAGLKADGTVVTCGRPLFEDKGDKGEFNVADWKEIVYVSAGNQTTVALKSDGTIICTGYNEFKSTKEWTDVVTLSQGPNIFGAIKTDGTVLNNYDDNDELILDLK